MGWADRYIERLERGEQVTLRPRGTSMEPHVHDGQKVTLDPLGARPLRPGTQGARGGRMISYVRIDETGSVYKAAGWEPVAETEARDWPSERHLFLPGIIEPTTEPIARVRWEIRR